MPNYGFKCIACENEFDKNVPLANRHEPQQCPCCESIETKRTYEPFYFRVETDREASGRKSGLNVDRYKAVRDARQKRQKEGMQNNALWGSDKNLSKDLGLNDKARVEKILGQQKVEGNNVVSLKS